ncbi:integrase catalytic domain-containing protein [Nephila pilipes]|uniref:Integrase catalytic domain-containing protein n=1 Tax=Nephila pilipes TaxID=299642 RepID=A0A8X6QQM5_NEPPI|nr:integrase catalytic domain-containing protein [Nephila pilipes]
MELTEPKFWKLLDVEWWGSERLNIYSFELRILGCKNGKEVVVKTSGIDEISRTSIRVPDRDICAEREYKGLALTFDFKELSNDGQILLLVGADYWDLIKGFQRLNSSLYRDLYPETGETLLKSFWVYDLVGGTEQVETALKITTECMEILKNTGMVLRKWQTYSVKLREAWRRAGIETQEDKTIEAGCGAPTKVVRLA